MLFFDVNTIDVDESVAEWRHIVGIGFDSHRAVVVEDLAYDVDTSVFDQFHYAIH